MTDSPLTTRVQGIENELVRIGFAPPDREFPGWHRGGVGVEVFDHPQKRYFEVIVWLIGNAVTPHVAVGEIDNPSLRWLRDTIRKAEQKVGANVY